MQFAYIRQTRIVMNFLNSALLTIVLSWLAKTKSHHRYRISACTRSANGGEKSPKTILFNHILVFCISCPHLLPKAKNELTDSLLRLPFSFRARFRSDFSTMVGSVALACRTTACRAATLVLARVANTLLYLVLQPRVSLCA